MGYEAGVILEEAGHVELPFYLVVSFYLLWPAFLRQVLFYEPYSLVGMAVPGGNPAHGRQPAPPRGPHPSAPGKDKADGRAIQFRYRNVFHYTLRFHELSERLFLSRIYHSY